MQPANAYRYGTKRILYIVLLQYVDDLLIVGINDAIIAAFKEELAQGKKNFIFTPDGGPLESYLGVNVYNTKMEHLS